MWEYNIKFLKLLSVLYTITDEHHLCNSRIHLIVNLTRMKSAQNKEKNLLSINFISLLQKAILNVFTFSSIHRINPFNNAKKKYVLTDIPLNVYCSNGVKEPQQQNPFDEEEEEWDKRSAEEDMNDALVDNGEPGVKVKALYDYEAAEEDELAFKTGDVFEKLEDEDEQGWCKGRKDGRVGLYPANYIEIVQ